jgi:coenzyme F420 hydrogenase subunit beta
VKNKHVTIEKVVKRKLCTGCGICAGICPQDAIDLTIDRDKGCYVPVIYKDRCTQCGLCYRVCPGHAVDFEGLSARLFGDIPEHVAVGRYLASYIGHATDDATRYRSSSGGLVPALLVFALGKGLIDGALVTRMRIDKPLRPDPFIARTKEEILSATGSKYCPVAADVAVKEILRSPGRYAVVGLPCHIQGIRKAEQEVKELRERIRYRISVACSLDYSFLGTERLLRAYGIMPESVERIDYRGRGWPGTLCVRLTDETERTVPLAEYYRRLGPYSLRRCTLCSDMLGELSDLSCGDAWLPRVAQTDKVGTSFVLSRTAEGDELLENAASDEAVVLSDLDLPDLVASQGHALFKKRKLKARMRLFRLCGQRTPKYQQKLLEPTIRDHVNSLKLYLARHALTGNHQFFSRFFQTTRPEKRRASKGPARREAVLNQP